MKNSTDHSSKNCNIPSQYDWYNPYSWQTNTPTQIYHGIHNLEVKFNMIKEALCSYEQQLNKELGFVTQVSTFQGEQREELKKMLIDIIKQF